MKPIGKRLDEQSVRLERLLPGPIERVWEYLTDPVKRGKWLATGTMELRVGGKVNLYFDHSQLSAEPTPEECLKYMGPLPEGRVTKCDPPHLLAYTWPETKEHDSEVTFELTPKDGEVLLVVTHSRMALRKTQLSVAAGWDAHTGILEDVLRGREPRPFWTTHGELRAEYDKVL